MSAITRVGRSLFSCLWPHRVTPGRISYDFVGTGPAFDGFGALRNKNHGKQKALAVQATNLMPALS